MLKPYLFGKPPYWQTYERNPFFASRNEKPEWLNKTAMTICCTGFAVFIPFGILIAWLLDSFVAGAISSTISLLPCFYLWLRKTGYYAQ